MEFVLILKFLVQVPNPSENTPTIQEFENLFKYTKKKDIKLW